MTIGLGCMRLSTAADRDDARAVAVIHAALDAGATLLDTADAYCHDERDVGHNERVVARALQSWNGDRTTITVATKGGLRRPKGQWVNDGRAKHLKDACEASLRALGVERIELYQLHAVDPKVEIETSVRALAALQRQGKIRDIGVCNVTVTQLERARAVADIAVVQVSLSVFDDESLRNGVAEYCRDNRIRLIAYRPLGGDRVKRLTRDPILTQIGAKHGATPADIALAWLMSFDADVVPIPGATRTETAAALARPLASPLDDADVGALDAHFSGRLLRVPRDRRRPAVRTADSEVVIVMGMPGAGKTTLARDLEAQGYERLNRDALGGSLADLVPRLDAALANGPRRIVLDNTYPSRASRNAVIETAWAHGVTARCVWLTTGLADAQVNAIHRLIDAHGRLPSPEDIRAHAANDPRYLLPDAQFRYERILEAPSISEGFERVDQVAFTARDDVRPAGNARAVILDADDLILPETETFERRRTRLTTLRADGWLLFVHAWRPDVARGATDLADVEQSLAQLRTQLGLDIDLAYCVHDAGPPICWCRKPIPGPLVDFARRRRVSLRDSIIIGGSAPDRTMAERLGTSFESTDAFFSGQR
jgi:aryl-alcohol dehydrogenase-like predicted oxidoreductase/predicted kinase/histidinol phosphatase-like enzyme